MADNQITQWEYKFERDGESKLNELGKEGWEAVGINDQVTLLKECVNSFL